MKPISHTHVKVIDKKFDQGRWFAGFLDTQLWFTWMEQPFEPTIGDEQILYIVKRDTKEKEELEKLLSAGSTQEQIQEWLEALAKRYGEFCTRSWDEIMGVTEN